MFIFAMLHCLFLTNLWLPAGKELTFWLSCVFGFLVCFFTFLYGVSGQVWYLSISVPDLLPSSLVSLVQENEFLQIILVICPRWSYAQDCLFKRPKMFIYIARQ